jgi:hypothetical protein
MYIHANYGLVETVLSVYALQMLLLLYSCVVYCVRLCFETMNYCSAYASRIREYLSSLHSIHR